MNYYVVYYHQPFTFVYHVSAPLMSTLQLVYQNFHQLFKLFFPFERTHLNFPSGEVIFSVILTPHESRGNTSSQLEMQDGHRCERQSVSAVHLSSDH